MNLHFDLEMANLGYKVLEFDGSIENTPYPDNKNIHFFKKFVGVKEDSNTISIEKILQEHSFSQETHNIFQCDIEDCEWDILEQNGYKTIV